MLSVAGSGFKIIPEGKVEVENGGSEEELVQG